MLTDLQTIYRPDTLEEAAVRLKTPGVFPIYGGGASLIRRGGEGARAAVDLSRVIISQCALSDQACQIESGTTLETIAASDDQLHMVIAAEVPLTLRNALTLGGVLMECRPNSLLLALLLGLDARVNCYGREPFNIARWFDLTADERRQCLIQNVVFPYYPVAPIRVSLEKISRTPADAPIVAALGFAQGGYRSSTKVNFYCVVCGLAGRPLRFQPADLPNLQSQISDYKGSAEYRTTVGKIVSQRAVLSAVKRASEGHW